MTRTSFGTSRGREIVRRWLPFLVVTGAYAAVALHQITLSGVYMDEVSPDFYAARLLNWNGPAIPPDLLPGNYLFDHFPILTSLQHGSYTIYLALPGFWLFGMSVAGLRITHGLFALGILATLYALLGASGVRRWWAALACTAIAIDPTFVYAFRTQSYLSLTPIAGTLLSLWALQRAAAASVDHRRRWIAVSGLLSGLAFAGYFTFLFFAPAIALAVMTRTNLDGEGKPQPLMRVAWWAAAFAVGTLPYVIGYVLLAQSQGGLAGGWAYIVWAQSQLGGAATHLSLSERFAFFEVLIRLVFSNASHHWLMFGAPVPVVGADLKTALLVALPPLIWVVAEYRKQATPMLRLLLGMQVTFSICALFFGGRLAGHHYVALVPIVYATLALALVNGIGDTARPWARWVYAAPFVVLLGLNAAGDVGEAATLRKTGGVGLYSDAINRFAEDLLRDHRNDFVVLADWGLETSTVFLTGGAVETDTIDNFPRARGLLCAGRNVSVALIKGDRAARFADWQREVQWGPPTIKDYRQRDGTIVFSLGTFSGREAGQWCPAPAATSQGAK